jgi:DNA-binding transcriptional LysR family regulator
MFISLRQVEAFLVSAKWGSFVAAASRLNTTQSNISKRIQELESSVGSPVFERGHRSLTLTLKGKQLVPHAEELLAKYTNFLEVAAPGSAFSGRFNIGAVSAVALSWLSSFIRNVREEYPGIIVSPQVDNQPQLRNQLVSGDIDLILAPTPSKATEFEMVPLSTEELVWVCHPQLAPPPDQMLSLQELARLPLIEHPSEENETFRLFTDRGIEMNIVATCSNFLTRAQFAVAGLGATHLPRYVVKREVERGRLVIIESEIPLPPIRYSAVYRRGDVSSLPKSLARIAASSCDFSLFLE